MKRTLLALTLFAALFGGILAPSVAGTVHAAPQVAAQTQSPTHFFNRTRFVVDIGLAFFAFHHWCYNAYKAHDLNTSHKVDLAKCGVALLFAVDRVHAAQKAANTSHSKTLHVLASPLNKMSSAFSTVGSRFKNHSFSSSDYKGLNDSVNGVSSTAAKNGLHIRDIPLSIPHL